MLISKKNLARVLVLVFAAIVAANLLAIAPSLAGTQAATTAGIPVEQPNGAPAVTAPVGSSAAIPVEAANPPVQPVARAIAATPAISIPVEHPDGSARAKKKAAPRRSARAPKVRRNTLALRVGFAWPVVKAGITSPFGWRPWVVMPGEVGPHPVRQFHHGADIGCALGDPVVAAKSGRVILSGVNPDYGNVIVIQHAGGWSTLYGHLSKRIARVGRRVPSNGLIGLCGKTGRATGTHLHFEVRRNGRFYNPIPFLP